MYTYIHIYVWSNQSILREINPEYSLEGLMLKLKLQRFGHLMRTDDSLEKSLMLEKIEGRRRRGCQRMRWLDGITHAMNNELGQTPGGGEGRGGLVCCSPEGHRESDMTGWMNNNSETYSSKNWRIGLHFIDVLNYIIKKSCINNYWWFNEISYMNGRKLKV